MNTPWFTRLLGVLFLGLIATGGLSGCQSGRQPVPPNPEEVFRFAVISDLHFGLNDATDKVTRTLKTVLDKAPDLSAIFFVGDLTDASAASSYDQLLRVVASTVPSTVRVVYMMGEHDRTTDATGALFRSKTGQEPNQYIELSGYPFVSVSVDVSATNGANCYAPATKAFLEEKMAVAAKKFTDRPIFVFYHIPVSGTIWGTSVPNNFASTALESAMNGYVQAIAFSGHTHFPLGDERSILQRKYTSINTSSSTYGLLPYGFTTAPEALYRPRGSAEVTEALLVSVNKAHQVTIERHNTFNGSTIKQPWVIHPPHDGNKFTYTDTRTGGTAPVFSPGAAITVGNISTSGCTISFPQATDDDMVYAYQVHVINQQTGLTEQILQLGSQFWNTVHMPSAISWNISALYAGYPYTIQVWAEDSWGQRSAVGLLSAPFTTLR